MTSMIYKFKDKINIRRKWIGLDAKNMGMLMGLTRQGYYYFINNKKSFWKIESLCNLLNALECVFDELFTESEELDFLENKDFTLIPHRNLRLRFKKLCDLKKIKLIKLAMDLNMTIQNLYYLLNNQKFHIDQIKAILKFFDMPFEEVFCEKGIYEKESVKF